MHTKIILLIIFFFIVSIYANDYRNAQYHFTCKIPFGWEEFPYQYVKEFEIKIKKEYGNKELPINYCGGLSFKQNKYYDDYPYILFSFIPYNSDISNYSFEELSKQIVESLYTDKLYEFMDKYNISNLVADYKSNKIIIDSVQKAIINTADLEIANVGFTRNVFASFIGKKGVLHVYCYSFRNNFESNLPTFKIVLNSMKFDTDYEFVDLTNYTVYENPDDYYLNNDSEADSIEVTENNTFKIIIFAIIIIFGFIVVGKNSTNKKYNLNNINNTHFEEKTSSPFGSTNYNSQANEKESPPFENRKTKAPDIDVNKILDYEELDDAYLTDDEKAKLYGKFLGLSGKISKTDIKKIYRTLIDKYHPDKVSHLGIEFQTFAEKKTKDINKAYQYFKRKYNL